MNDHSETSSGDSIAEGSAASCGARSASHLQCGPVLGAFAALLAGLLVWGTWQAMDPVFVMPEELTNLPSPVPADLAIKQDQATAVMNRHNAILALGILGAVVGLFLATCEAGSRRALKSACWRSPMSAALAGLFGAGAGLAGSLVLESPELLGGWTPLAKTVVVQGVTLGILGLGVGVGVALPHGRLRLILRSATGGILGGLLAGLICPVVVAFLLPAAQTERVMPNDVASRLIWMTAAAVLIALVLTGLGKRSRPMSRASV